MLALLLIAAALAEERPSGIAPAIRPPAYVSDDSGLPVAIRPPVWWDNVRTLPLARRQQLTVATVGLALFNDVLLLLMLVPMLPSLLDDPAGAGDMRLACLFSAKDVCQVVCAPIAGAFTLRAGARRSLVLSLFGLAASTIGFAEARGFRQLLAARALQGVTSAALMSGGLTLIAETHDATLRGPALAAAHSGLGLGAALGPVLGGLLLDSYGRRATFYMTAGLVGLNGIAALLLGLVCPAPLLGEASGGDAHTSLRGKAGKAGKAGRQSAAAQLVALLRTRDIAIVAGGIFGAYAAGGCFDAVFGVHVADQFGMGAADASRLFSVEPITYVILLGLLRPLAARPHPLWSKQRLSALGLALTGLSLPMLTLYGRRASVLASCVVHGAGYACKDIVGHGLLADLVDESGVGSYAMAYALADAADSAGYIFGPLCGFALCNVMASRTAGLLLVGLGCASLAPPLLGVGAARRSPARRARRAAAADLVSE